MSSAPSPTSTAMHNTIRAPYRNRNALIGMSLFGFCAAVVTYSIRAVKQESFEDVEAMIAEKRKSREASSASAASAAAPPSSAQ
ncbi:hypothetical protein BC828DRAFT_380582 [Blastocladiella britannica]|nr:hypothetical protein BC828DRAFT_380582 [Blastocladiella britannica]